MAMQEVSSTKVAIRKCFSFYEDTNNISVVSLIKAYREYTGMSLMESKNNIEKIVGSPNSLLRESCECNPEQTITNLEKLFFGNGRICQEGMKQEDELYNALTHLNGNWKVLGYSSYKDAVISISNNF